MRSHLARAATIATLITASIISCAKKGGGDADVPVVTAPAAGSGAGPKAASLQAPVETHRKVIHTGRVELIVETFDAARTQLEALVTAAGGYVDSADISLRHGSHYATIVLRIPADGYGELIGKLGGLGEVASESTTAADVTDQYVDVAARLASTRALENRLRELAAERTTATVEQVLAVERELGRVRGEIEGYEGHVRQWDDQIAMSTLTLTMYPRREAPSVASLGDRSSDAFHGSIEGLRNTAAGLLLFAIAVLPWAIVLVPSFLLGRRLWRRLRPQLPRAVVQPPASGEIIG
jgi:uncharacterized protein DUF4349